MFDDARKRLVETGARNRLVHVNRTKARGSVINVIGGEPDNIFNVLSRGRAVRFLALESDREPELARLRKQLTIAETAIGNLFGFVETGLYSPRDPDFAKRMVDRRSDAAGLRARIRDLEEIVARQNPALDNAAVQAFTDLLKQKLRGDDPKLRKFYVNLLVSDVTVSSAGIRIRGARAALAPAAINHKRLGHGPVPIFDREWCRLGDSNT